MRCIVCKEKIQAGNVHEDIWIQTSNGKMVKVPKSRIRHADRIFEGFFTCAVRSTDPVGDRCIDKLRRGEFS